MKKKWWTYQELVDNDLLNFLFYTKNYYLYKSGNIIENPGAEYNYGISPGYPEDARNIGVTPNISNVLSLFYGPYKPNKHNVLPKVPKKLDKQIRGQFMIENIIK